MEINKIDESINVIIESSINHSLATQAGDYKVANKNYQIIKKAVDYLKENGEIETLKCLLNNDEVSVQVWVASFLLNDGENQVLKVLEKIASQSIPLHSFNARMILQERRK